jgi:tetraacyldisaccharide-1-P 4'-kinase
MCIRDSYLAGVLGCPPRFPKYLYHVDIACFQHRLWRDHQNIRLDLPFEVMERVQLFWTLS